MDLSHVSKICVIVVYNWCAISIFPSFNPSAAVTSRLFIFLFSSASHCSSPRTAHTAHLGLGFQRLRRSSSSSPSLTLAFLSPFFLHFGNFLIRLINLHCLSLYFFFRCIFWWFIHFIVWVWRCFQSFTESRVSF